MRRQDEEQLVPGFLGPPPSAPVLLVERPDLLSGIVRVVRDRGRLIAVTGPGGAGKSTLTAQACADRRVRRAFRDGIVWLDAGPGRDPVTLLATLAHRLGRSGVAAGFAAVEQARDQLSVVLRDRRVLIALDNVHDQAIIDAFTGLSATVTVLFTTRFTELAVMAKATEVTVGPLTAGQSLELLNRSAGFAAAPPLAGARALGTGTGQLPLGVVLAAGMAAGGRTFASVLDAIERATSPAVGDEPEPDADDALTPEYLTLFHVGQAAVADLPEPDQNRYAQLAVFADHGPFPAAAVRALWPPDLAGAGVDRLLAGLVDRSLLMRTADGWYQAHDLQYDVMESQLGTAGLAAAHHRLLDGYRGRYPGGWADSAADPYLGRQLAGHLNAARLGEELHAVLTDVTWIEGRLTHGHAHDLIPDYRYAGDPLSRQILRTLRLSAAEVATDPAAIRSRLAERLRQHPDPGIAAWAARLARPARRNGRPRTALTSLTSVTGSGAVPLKRILAGHAEAVRAVAVCAGQPRAVSGGDDGTVRVWDLRALREEAVLTGHTDWVRAVAVTPDGRRAVSGGDDGTVRVWDLSAGTGINVLTTDGRAVWSVAVTPDGTCAVTGGEDGDVRVWDLTAGTLTATLPGHTRPIWSLAVTPDGSRAVSASGDGTIRVWDLGDGRELASLAGHEGEVFAVAVTSDGARAVSGGADSTVRLWDLPAGRPLRMLTGHTGWVWSVAVTPEGTRAVSAGEDGAVRVWDLADGVAEAALTGHDRQVFAVTVSPDGTRAVSGGEDGTVREWDLPLARAEADQSGHPGWVWSVAVTADGTRAVSGGSDTTVRMWDLATSRELMTLSGHTRPVWSVAVTADGTRAVSAGSDRTVRVWDLATGQELTRLSGHDGPVWSVAVAPDGEYLVSGGADATVRWWDPATGRELGTLPGHAGPVFAVAVTAGMRAVSGGADGTVRLWDLAAGRELAACAGHEGPVWSVAVTPDGTRAVSGGADGTVRVWDLAAGRELATCTGHDGHVFAVGLTRDGRQVISGGEDATVRTWDADHGHESASWSAGHPVIGCAALPGQPLRICVGQGQGPPSLLELRSVTPSGVPIPG